GSYARNGKAVPALAEIDDLQPSQTIGPDLPPDSCDTQCRVAVHLAQAPAHTTEHALLSYAGSNHDQPCSPTSQPSINLSLARRAADLVGEHGNGAVRRRAINRRHSSSER